MRSRQTTLPTTAADETRTTADDDYSATLDDDDFPTTNHLEVTCVDLRAPEECPPPNSGTANEPVGRLAGWPVGRATG